MKGKRQLTIAAALLAAALLVGAGMAGAVLRAQDWALTCIASPSDGVTVMEDRGRLVFAPEEPTAGLIFYPGGNVQMESYAPLMDALAQRGVLCVLLPMPLNLAILNIDAAAGVSADYPKVSRWYIGGHSLGGYAAASHLAKAEEAYSGLVLLAAYTQEDFSASGLRALSVTATQDGVLNQARYREGLALLPQGYQEVVIEGGCHAYFGDYGAQKGDGVPSITREEQIIRTADAVAAFIAGGE